MHVLKQLEGVFPAAHAKAETGIRLHFCPALLDLLDIVHLAAPAKAFREIAKALFLNLDRFADTTPDAL